MHHDQLVGLVQKATHEVFKTMVGIALSDQDAFLDTKSPSPSEGVVAIVGLAGRWVGSGTFSTSATGARRIVGRMLMQEYHAVDEEVLDAIGEITNMILGNVKTGLEEAYGPMGLSIPTVIYGRNFTTRSVGKNQWTVVPFGCEGERVEVHLCLVPGSEAHASLKQSAILSVMD
jgi:chemotaxis protein CheX